MTDHRATVPAAVRRAYPTLTGHPLIVEVFHPDRGWLTLRGLPIHIDRYVKGTYRKRISPSCARKLHQEGVTAIALDLGDGRVADFQTRELARG